MRRILDPLTPARLPRARAMAALSSGCLSQMQVDLVIWVISGPKDGVVRILKGREVVGVIDNAVQHRKRWIRCREHVEDDVHRREHVLPMPIFVDGRSCE